MFLPKNYVYELPDLYIWFQNIDQTSITAEMLEHPAWKELKNSEKTWSVLSGIIPKNQLRITSPIGTISIIQAGCSFGLFEIYCIKGALFNDIRRYKTIIDTGKTVLSLLTTGKFLNEEDEDEKK